MILQGLAGRLGTALALSLTLLAPCATTAQVTVPALLGHVTDQTKTLAPEKIAALEQTLSTFEARKGSQLAVLIVPSTAPEEIEQFALRVAEQWKLGRKKVDDGAILVVAKNDRAHKSLTEQFADHGHDHIGNNRGMEQHPIMGTNFRIGEINAAIGLAQTRKLSFILEKQRAHKAIIQARLSKIAGLQFRRHTDEAGDSATFFHLLLPSEQLARATVKLFAEAGIPHGYWYDNMFHYIKQWDHVKNLSMPYKLVAHELGLPQDLKTMTFPKSDAVMSRLISFNIRVTWTAEELDAMLGKMEGAVRKVMEGVTA